MAEVRGVLGELQPLVLTDTDLGDLLRQLGDALTGRSNIPVTVTITDYESLPADAQLVFYRLCQEALNNIAKHARASQVAIQLQQIGDTVELHIHDNGRGFDPEHTPSGHYGLSIMHERAKSVGAVVVVKSQPKSGTEVVIRWTQSSNKDVQ
jgi:signal transduction histidine kinase